MFIILVYKTGVIGLSHDEKVESTDFRVLQEIGSLATAPVKSGFGNGHRKGQNQMDQEYG